MARTALTAISAPGNYASSGTAMTMTAADAVNGNSVPSTGKELIVAFNSGASTYHLTINSVADPFARTGDITSDPLTAGQYKVYGPFPVTGWRQTDGNLYLSADNAAVEICVIKLP